MLPVDNVVLLPDTFACRLCSSNRLHVSHARIHVGLILLTHWQQTPPESPQVLHDAPLQAEEVLPAPERPLVVVIEEAEAVDTLTLQDLILVLSEVHLLTAYIATICGIEGLELDPKYRPFGFSAFSHQQYYVKARICSPGAAAHSFPADHAV